MPLQLRDELMEPYKFPRPPTHQDFEALIERLGGDRHPDAVVQRFGRNGQGQHGIDVLLAHANGTVDAYQCKHVQSLSAATVHAEANAARSFPEDLGQFIIYTTAPRDARNQTAALEASRRHPYRVVVHSWDDIAVDLMNNLGASQDYMKRLPMHSLVSDYMRQLRNVFDRPAFTQPAEFEWSFREQLQAIRDTQEFLATGQLDTRDARFVLRSLPAISVPGIRTEMSSVRQLLADMKTVVTPAAKAERTGDHNGAALFSAPIEQKRTGLMNCLNGLLQNHDVPLIQS